MSKDSKSPQARSDTSGYGRPFVDYYNKHNVIPVSQNLLDLEGFILQRNFLYSNLGAPLRQFHNRSVIEFGPGGGFNAVATAIHQPELYVLVDAVQASLAEINSKKDSGKFRAKAVEVVDSDIFEYSDGRKFDYAIIEGVICGQDEPERMLRHVSGFVNESGMLITTTTSAASMLSEICRRLLRIRICEVVDGFAAQVKFSSKVFDSHLKSLGAITRPVEDWVIDVIFHDWHTGKYIFTLRDSADAIKHEFDFYRSLPSFLTDDRWHKKITRTSLTSTELLVQQYPMLAGCLLDHRISLSVAIPLRNQLTELEGLSVLACEVHDSMISSGSYENLDEFFRLLREIARSLPVEFAPTISAIKDFVASLPRFIDDPYHPVFDDFRSWWGRGQQYASFIRSA